MTGLLRNAANRCLNSFRTFSKTVVRYEKPVVDSVAEAQSGRLSNKTHRVNNFEKRLLVWTGKYKTVDEVPALVSPDMMEKARSRTRVRVANYMMLMTALACLAMIISGKQAALRGESVQKTNIEWHKRVKEDAEKNAAK